MIMLNKTWAKNVFLRDTFVIVSLLDTWYISASDVALIQYYKFKIIYSIEKQLSNNLFVQINKLSIKLRIFGSIFH